MKREKFSTRVLAEVAIFAALAFALDALQGGIWRGVFASGGSIGLAMVPIFLISYRRGLIPGILCGFIVSIVQMLGGIYVINAASYENAFLRAMGPFLQILLDYVLAYTVVGFAGAFAGGYANGKTRGKKIIWIVVGTILGGGLKYACHVIAGGVFWLNQGATFLNVSDASWGYSFLYNGAYCIPNIVICTVLMVLVARFYPQFLAPNTKIGEEDSLKQGEKEEVTDEQANQE